MKPVIGINLDIEGEKPKLAKVQAFYYESVKSAGGIPVLIPPLSDQELDQLLSRLDGLLLTGGNDYCPSRYGETKHESVELAHDDRLDFDWRLLKKSIERPELPVLGICAGSQILNIALGGSLYQDIPSDFPGTKVEHSTKNGWKNGFNFHKVKLNKGSKLLEIYGIEEIDVPTSHHQAVKKLGSGLVAAASAEDGVVEAVEYENRPFVIGVQWHPERDYEGNQKLFKAFVQAALAELKQRKA